MGRRFYKYAEVDVEVDFDDVVEYIDEYATKKEKAELIGILNQDSDNSILIENIYDLQKYNIVIDLYKNLSLDQLEKISNNPLQE